MSQERWKIQAGKFKAECLRLMNEVNLSKKETRI